MFDNLVLGDQAGLFGRGTSGEGCDTDTLELPGVQRELAEAVLATGTPVVMVLLTGRPYAIGWALDRCAAVVQAFFPGEEGAAAIAGVLNPERLRDPENAREAAAYIARRLDLLSEETEQGWEGEPTSDGGLTFVREVRGVREVCTIDGKLISSAEAMRLDRKASHLQEIYGRAATLKRKADEVTVRGPTQLLEAVFATGRKGISLQRYKGLGEMNPQQLWETTLDANARSLLKVEVRELDQADDLFTKLMGDVVDPRREFIRENALQVANLDV